MPRRYLGSYITYNPVEPTASAASGMWPLNQQFQEVGAGTWPLPFGDPYFNYTTLLLSSTSLSNANNNLFVDSSGAFNPISRTGNTTQGSFAPYGTYWSNYFDGSGDYLTIPNNSAFSYGTGDFTMEAWVYKAASGDMAVVDSFTGGGGTFGFLVNDTQVVGYQTNVVAYTFTYTVPRNTWTHIAFVRTGGNLICYVNGASIGSQANSANFTSSNSIAIGRNPGSGGSLWQGYISNLRIVKGTAVYTAAFTPSTVPLTAISGTSLLTCQSNRFRDASANNFTVTPSGDTRVTDFSPFLHTAPIQYNQGDITNWSGYFDGSGDDLRIASNSAFSFGTGDFTIEGWCYLSSNTGNYRIIVSIPHSSGWVQVRFGGAAEYNSLFQVSILTTAASNVYSTQVSQAAALGRWMHFAFTRSSGTCRVFLDGVQQNLGTGTNPSSFPSSSFSDSTNISNNGTVSIGNDIPYSTFYIGNLSNIRMVKGTAVYTSNFTPPTTNLTAISGTSLLTLQSAAFTDNSTNSFPITITGDTTVTGNSPFNTVGYWSNYFDGNGDYLSVPNSSSLDFGTGDFTLEAWVYFTSLSGRNALFGSNATGGFDLQLSTPTNLISLGRSDVAYDFNSSFTFAVGQWYHVAITRASGTARCFVNGVLINSASNSISYNQAGGQTLIGASVSSGSIFHAITGYISNVRAVKGTAVYTSAFTPPTTPLTAISGTSLLTCQNARLIDNSSNNFTITRNGDVSVQSFDPFYTSTIASGGGSMYFDGNAEFLDPLLPSTSLPGSWTIECWFYATATGGLLFDARPNNTNGYYPNLGVYSSTQLDFYYNANSNFITVSGGTLNRWVHVAVVKNGTSLNVYADGVSVFSATDSNTWAIGASRPRIGANGGYYGAAPGVFTGYISNLRIINGTAAYTAAFTPPTAPVSPTPNTILMLNGMNAGAFDATATNDFETVGNAQVRFPTPFAPANYWAGAFDGSGDYLESASNSAFSILSGGDFTVEAWVYFNSISDNGGYGAAVMGRTAGAGDGWIFRCKPTAIEFVYPGLSANSTSFTFATGQWYHIVAQRNGSTLYYYVNGTRYTPTYSDRTTDASAQAMFIGRSGNDSGGTYAYINGYISNARIVKGTAVYSGTTITVPTTPLAAVSGTSLLTCQNKTFIDNSSNAFTITANGNATAGAIGPFTATGGTSMYFDGTGDYLITRSNPDLYAFGSGDFTIEFWLYLNSTAGAQIFYDGRPASTPSTTCPTIYMNTQTLLYYANGANRITGATLSANTWYHVALSRSGTSTRMFLNGTQTGSTYTDSTVYTNSAARPMIGNDGNDVGVNGTNGYINDLRVTKGYARYTSNFTPPTAALPTY